MNKLKLKSSKPSLIPERVTRLNGVVGQVDGEVRHQHLRSARQPAGSPTDK